MTREVLIRKLDRLFSEVLRWERSENGLVQCFTCGRWLTVEEATIGHFIKRQFMGTRYNEINCQVQCRRCNYLLQGNDVEFAKRLQERFGEQIVEKLKLASRRNIPTWNLSLILDELEKRQKDVKQKRVKNE